MTIPAHEREQHGCAADAGFTLIEALVVLALVALAVTIGVPRAGLAQRDLALRAAASDLAADLAMLRAAAMRTNREQTMTIDAAARTFDTGGGAPRVLPPALDVELLTIRSERSGATSGRLRFYPDGSSTGGRIVLRDGTRLAAVTVDWLTGGARVEKRR